MLPHLIFSPLYSSSLAPTSTPQPTPTDHHPIAPPPRRRGRARVWRRVGRQRCEGPLDPTRLRWPTSSLHHRPLPQALLPLDTVAVSCCSLHRPRLPRPSLARLSSSMAHPVMPPPLTTSVGPRPPSMTRNEQQPPGIDVHSGCPAQPWHGPGVARQTSFRAWPSTTLHRVVSCSPWAAPTAEGQAHGLIS